MAMMNNLLIKVIGKAGVLETVSLKQGVNTAIKAIDNINFLIIDKQTGTSPKQLEMLRKGNDLYVKLADNELLIIDYYQVENSNIIGLVDGAYHPYNYNVANQINPIDSLISEQGTIQQLGAEAHNVAWWETASSTTATTTTAGVAGASVGMNSLAVLGAIGAGAALVGAAAGGSSNSDSNDKPSPTPKPNNSPTDITLSNDDVTENADGAVIGKLTTTDQDKNDNHTYTVSDNRFEVVNGELKLKQGQSLDYEKEQSVKVTVTTNDGKADFSKEFTINITDDVTDNVKPNNPPTDITLDKNTVAENAEGAIIGKLTTTDVDPTDKHTYTVNDHRFEINSKGELKLKAGQRLDFEDASSISIEVTTNDGKATYSKTFTINVTDVNENNPPTDIILSNNKVTENDAGAIIGKLTTTDADSTDSHTYIVNDPRFEINSEGELKLKAGQSLDYEIEKTINIKVTSNDGEASFSKDFVINVSDDLSDNIIPDTKKPIITSGQTFDYQENQEAGYTIGKVKATDNKGITNFTIIAGNDDGYFVIDKQGNISLTAIGKNALANDFEQTPNEFNLSVQASDKAGNSSTESVKLKVTDDASDNNHAPTAIALSNTSVTENVEGAIIGKLTTIDADATDSHTYTVNDPRFEINDKGELKLKAGQSLDYEKEKSVTVKVTTDDGHGGKYSENVTINVTDINENHKPTDISLSKDTVAENDAGATIGKLNTTDQDISDTHTYTVNDPRFEVNSKGELKLKAGQSLDYEKEKSVTVKVTTDDGHGGKYSENVTINVTDVDEEAPSINAQTFSYKENQSTDYQIGKVTATDNKGITEYQITAGNDDGYFAIDSKTGRISLTAKGASTTVKSNDFETTPNSFDLTINVKDEAGNNSSGVVTIKVEDDISDNTPVEAPTIDDITSDNRINVTEANDQVTISGTATAGKVVEIHVGNKTFETTADSSGKYATNIDGKYLKEDSDYQVIANIKDSMKEAGRSYQVDDYVAANIDITNMEHQGIFDFNNGENTVRVAGNINIDPNSLLAKGLNEYRVKSIEITINGETYHAGIHDKTFFVDVDVDDMIQANKLNYKLNIDHEVLDLQDGSRFGQDWFIEVKDTAGMELENDVTVSFNSPLVNGVTAGTANIDSNSLDEQSVQTISGTVSGSAKVGDEVVVTIGDKDYKTKVQVGDKFSVDVKTIDLQGSGLDKVTATLHATDNVGNSVTVSDVDNITTGAKVSGEQVSWTNKLAYDDLPEHIKVLESEDFIYNGYAPDYLQNIKYGAKDGVQTIKYYIANSTDPHTHPIYLDSDSKNSELEFDKDRQDFTENNKIALRDAVAKIESYIGINFEETNNQSEADFSYFMGNVNGGRDVINVDPDKPVSFTTGYAYHGGNVHISHQVYGDYTGTLQGSLDHPDGFHTIVHETLHSLGATHSFPEYVGKPALDIDGLDSIGLSVMSYDRNGHDDFIDQLDLRIFDLAFLHYRFGVNPNARAGNDTYGFKNFNTASPDGDIYVWDGAGVDTFDASNESKGVYVDLTPGAMSYRGDPAVVAAANNGTVDNFKFAAKGLIADKEEHNYFSEINPTDRVVVGKAKGDDYTLLDGVEKTYDFTDDQILIGYGTQIENVTGSAYQDTLKGNEADNVMYGGAGNDTITGGKGNDYLDGGLGSDILNGGTGDDVYIIDNIGDKISETDGNDTIITTLDTYNLNDGIENITLIGNVATSVTGNDLNNLIIGNNNDNVISGGAGNDTLKGQAGSDTLTGGDGKDLFIFDSKLDGSIDTIADLSLGDVIQLDDDIFTSLKGKSGSDIMDYIDYDKSSGALSYDSDAGGSATAVQFAILSNHVDINENYFAVI